MALLNILDNDILHMAAETLLIVTGSMLLGILVSYFYYTRVKQELTASREDAARFRKEADDLRSQLHETIALHRAVEAELDDARLKINQQSRTLHDQYLHLREETDKQTHHRAELDELRSQVETYRARLKVIEDELAGIRIDKPAVDMREGDGPAGAPYAHVSDILGRAVTENDLTAIAGIGPKTAALLRSHGIATWKDLANTSVEFLRQVLDGEGGPYKGIDPGHWPGQARMAERGEWRKLRAYQEYLRRQENQ